jgi:hypothetical protein
LPPNIRAIFIFIVVLFVAIMSFLY